MPEAASQVAAETSAEPEKQEEKSPSRISKISIVLLIIGAILCIVGAIELVLSVKG